MTFNCARIVGIPSLPGLQDCMSNNQETSDSSYLDAAQPIESREQDRDRQDDIWGDLDDGWWRIEVRQGRLFRPRLDMLLNYWLAMRAGPEVSPARVFDVFRSYVEDEDVHGVMSDVKKDLMNYRDFESTRGRNPDEKSFYYHIDVMQARVKRLPMLCSGISSRLLLLTE